MTLKKGSPWAQVKAPFEDSSAQVASMVRRSLWVIRSLAVAPLAFSEYVWRALWTPYSLFYLDFGETALSTLYMSCIPPALLVLTLLDTLVHVLPSTPVFTEGVVV